jgi:hypothetical protein
MLREVAAENPTRVYLFDLNRLLDPGGHFASHIDGFTVRYNDGVHITPSGDCLIAPQVLPYVVEALKAKSAPSQPVSAADVESAMARIPATACPPAGASPGTSPAGTS